MDPNGPSPTGSDLAPLTYLATIVAIARCCWVTDTDHLRPTERVTILRQITIMEHAAFELAMIMAVTIPCLDLPSSCQRRACSCLRNARP